MSDNQSGFHLSFRDVGQFLALVDRLTGHYDTAQILHILQEIQMSGAQLTQLQAETSAALDAVATQLTEISDDVDRLLAGQTAGDQVTPEMLAAGTSIRDRVVAARDAMQAINTKGGDPTGPVTHTPADPSDSTANGQPRTDGSLRNNFNLPGFDASLPETT